MIPPNIFADFHNKDSQGRLRLNCAGTINDLNAQKVELKEGLLLTLYSEKLKVNGMVQYSQEESLWVAIVNWTQIKQRKQGNLSLS